MPLNQPKQGSYIPNPVGPVKLITRSATRARLYAAGTFFRSYERGQQANLIKIGVIEDTNGTLTINDEAICVVHHTQLKPDEQIFPSGSANIQLLKLSIDWNQEIRIWFNGVEWRCERTGIRWQIAPGPVPTPVDLGTVKDGLFSVSNVSFRVTNLASWPTGAEVYLRPRTRRYTLVTHVVTDPDTMTSTTGWDPNALRATLNSDPTGFVRMPVRGVGTTPPTTGAEDRQDEGVDGPFIVPTPMTSMSGGDGLPAAPVGWNTGPDRVLIHLNYAERDDGSMGELNQIFEWVGDTAALGSWQRYS